MGLSEIEKKEMLEDAKNKKRKINFRKVRYSKRKMSFEEYISWVRRDAVVKFS
jgi:hypothetical protein